MAPLRRFSDFSLDDYLSAEEAEGLQADGAGTDAVGLVLPLVAAVSGGPLSAAAEALQAGALQFEVASAVLPAHGTAGRVARLQAQVWRELRRGYPRVYFKFAVSEPPYQDVGGQGFYFDRAYGVPKEEAEARKLRREAKWQVEKASRSGRS